MIKVICIDDEKDALEVLQIQLHQHFEHEVQVLGLYSDSREGIAAILELKPDLVFLDIEMPFKNGFEVLEETKEIHFKVIFTTAYNQFAIKAFKVSAVDYLLKPIDGLELVAAVKKVIVGNQEKMQNQIAALLNQFSTKQAQDKIALNIGDTLQFFNAEDIIRFESDSNYTHIYLKSGKKITTAKTLKDVEEKLGGTIFFRIHHSHLVNLNYVVKYIKGNAGYAEMLDGSLISISRAKKEEFLEKYRCL